MPTRIPVRIAEHEFSSLNRARLHYLGILHRYQPGQNLCQADGDEVSELSQPGASPRSPASSAGYRVVQGNYGRKCFATVVNENDVRMISIMRSVKSFIAPAENSSPHHLGLFDSAHQGSAVHPGTGSATKAEPTVQPVATAKPKEADEIKPACQSLDGSPPVSGRSGSHAQGQKQGNPKKAEKSQTEHAVKQRGQ